LCIATGNCLRRDDGVAHRVLDLVGVREGVVRRDALQLTPELAGEFRQCDVVVFLDADAGSGEPRIEQIDSSNARHSPLGHAMTPEEVVSLARRLYDFRGAAFIARVPGVDFGHGEGLSSAAEANAHSMAGMLSDFLSAKPEAFRCTSLR
jgi:hydrogenase maturation protease